MLKKLLSKIPSFSGKKSAAKDQTLPASSGAAPTESPAAESLTPAPAAQAQINDKPAAKKRTRKNAIAASEPVADKPKTRGATAANPGRFQQSAQHTGACVIPRDQHNVSRRNMSESAIKVLHRLNAAGYQAYLVGGGIRDLLLDGHPKDFDIATNATPEDIQRHFRNSRLIGRRFRIVHVVFGREIIEVTTFRGHHSDEDDQPPADSNAHKVNEHGLLLRDNVYGTIEEDALRRDFTVNALYYDIQNFSVLDFVDGMSDIQSRQIRLIGDPEKRYREDPVRMLRAIRFAAKLDFAIEPDTAEPIQSLAYLLDHIPPARLFEEVLKLLSAGYGVATWQLLCTYGLAERLFPQTLAALRQGEGEALILAALKNTDQRIQIGKSVTPYFLYGALLWPAVKVLWEKIQAKGELPYPALQLAMQQVINQQVDTIAIPRRFSTPMREIWELQLRLPKRNGKRAYEMMAHPRFRAAYDFLVLREHTGETTGGAGAWWTAFQEANGSDEQQQLLQQAPSSSPRPRKRRRSRRPPNATSD